MQYKDVLGIESMPWPGNSPDLNPIENVWAILKRKVCQKKPTTIQELKEIIEYTWYNDISMDFIRKVYESMPHRVESVIRARGGPTRY